jgi:NTP pyrophosphatase (non-canonical NTP hydrolase)
MKSLNELRDEALATAKANGFTHSSVGEDVALMHSELSELLEDFRAGYEPAEIWYTRKDDEPLVTRDKFIGEDGLLNKPCGIPSELADVIIRALHFAGKHNIDLDQIVSDKMAYNKTRSFMHGKKL